MKRARLLRRTAAASAAAVSAALLVSPSGASAVSDASTPVAGDLPTTSDHRDYNADGHQDLLAVRRSDGALMLHAGNGDGTLAGGVVVSTGWGAMDINMAGDLTGDGNADLLASDAKTGTLYAYPGDGAGGFGDALTVRTGWSGMGVFTSGGDYNSDGKVDMYAVGDADAKLYFYPGLGNGKFGSRVALGTGDAGTASVSGWNVMDALVSVGDADADGNPDLLAHNARNGRYYLYKGDGAAGLGSVVGISASLDGSGTDRYNQIAAAGDQDGDGREDLFAVDTRSGELERHSLNGNGTAVHEGEVVAIDWSGNRLGALNQDRTYDYNGDGKADLIARDETTGTTYLYSGNGSNGFGARVSLGNGLEDLDLIETAGDLDGDGFADLIGRNPSLDTLFLYPGKGNGQFDFTAGVPISTGWNAMGAIVSGSDFDSDGKIDILASERGTVWLYPGNGDGTFGERVRTAYWADYLEYAAVGDLNHDGHADLLGHNKWDDCLYVDYGVGDGTFDIGWEIACYWFDPRVDHNGLGDFNRDGHTDWIARSTSERTLSLCNSNGATDSADAVRCRSVVDIPGDWSSLTIA
jgi:hypothetical protein